MNMLSMPSQAVRHSIIVLMFALPGAGCVTEISGGFPAPASAETRARAQLDLARGYLEQRAFNRARPALTKALKIDPQLVEAHVLYAVLFHAENEYELAEQSYRTALRIEPDNAQALHNYGTFLYSRKRFDDALKPLNKLVKNTEYRARAQAFENLGLANLSAGNDAAAEAAFVRSLELNFRQARATLELGYMAYDKGDYARASARLLEYKTMARQNARSLCLRMKVASQVDDVNQLASATLALKNLFPDQASKCQVKS